MRRQTPEAGDEVSKRQTASFLPGGHNYLKDSITNDDIFYPGTSIDQIRLIPILWSDRKELGIGPGAKRLDLQIGNRLDQLLYGELAQLFDPLGIIFVNAAIRQQARILLFSLRYADRRVSCWRPPTAALRVGTGER